MIDRDIWIAANAMLKLYGEDAAAQAAIRAEALSHAGDKRGRAAWKRVIAAINDLRITKPNGTAH